MRPFALAALLGVTLLASPLALSEGIAGALVLLALSLVLAVLAAERRSPLALALGSLGALVHVGLSPVSAGLAGGLLVLAIHTPRALRARTLSATSVQMGVALVTGTLGAMVAARYGGADTTVVRMAALVVAGVLGVAARVFPADDPCTAEIERLAGITTEPARGSFVAAAELRRRMLESGAMEQLSPATRERVEAAWASLEEIASLRVAMAAGNHRGEGLARMDEQIASYVDALTRLHDAADARRVGNVTIADAGLAGAKSEGENIEAEVQALTELQTGRVVGQA